MDVKKEKECSSDDEDNDSQDNDSCGYGEIKAQFGKWSKVSEGTVEDKSAYILDLAVDGCFSSVAVGTTSSLVHIFKISTSGLVHSRQIGEESAQKLATCGVQFTKENDNLLYLGFTSGLIEIFDLRIKERIYAFEEILETKRVPIMSFDTNSNGRIICAGSEKVLKDTYLLFFDTRQRKSLGSYCESHDDDITSTKFHPSNPDYLMTGSTDGLINVFDISKTNEYDALETVINTENSVQKLQWHPEAHPKYAISCITHTDDLKIYDSDEGDLLYKYTRVNVTEAIRRKSPGFCYLVNCHSKNDGSILLLAGSNYKDKTLRSVLASRDGLHPLGNFEGNDKVVRETVLSMNENMLLTVGESATIDLWHEIPEASTQKSFKMKTKLNSKFLNKNPY